MANHLTNLERERQLEKIRGKAKRTRSTAGPVGGGSAWPSKDAEQALQVAIRRRYVAHELRRASPGRYHVLTPMGMVVRENQTADQLWDWLTTVARPPRSTKKRAKKKTTRKPAKRKATKKKPAKKKPAKRKATKKKATKKKGAKKPKKKRAKKTAAKKKPAKRKAKKKAAKKKAAKKKAKKKPTKKKGKKKGAKKKGKKKGRR